MVNIQWPTLVLPIPKEHCHSLSDCMMTAFFSRFMKYGPLNSDIDSRFSRSSSYPSVTNYNLEFPLTPPFAESAEIYVYDTMKYTVIERSLLTHFRLHGMNQDVQSKVILPAALSTGSISKMILAGGTFF